MFTPQGVNNGIKNTTPIITKTTPNTIEYLLSNAKILFIFISLFLASRFMKKNIIIKANAMNPITNTLFIQRLSEIKTSSPAPQFDNTLTS